MHHDRDSDLIGFGIGIGIAIEIFDYENDYDYEHEKVWLRVNPRDISTSQLNASRRLHLWPITT